MKKLLRWRMPRSVRRVLVAVYFLLFATGFAILFLGAGGSHEWDVLAVVALLFAVVLGSAFSLVASPADFRPAVMLDERQNALRLRAMADSYRVVAILIYLCALAIALQHFYGYELPMTRMGPIGQSYRLLPLVFLLPGLPQALVAWREPDLDADDSRTLPQ